jgi:hypothetical protein
METFKDHRTLIIIIIVIVIAFLLLRPNTFSDLDSGFYWNRWGPLGQLIIILIVIFIIYYLFKKY